MVNFNTTLIRDDESVGSLTFILETNRPADQIFTVQVCTEDFVPVIGTRLQVATGLVYITKCLETSLSVIMYINCISVLYSRDV